MWGYVQVFTVAVAVVLGVVFWKVQHNLGGVQDRAGFLFFIIFFFSLTSLRCPS